MGNKRPDKKKDEPSRWIPGKRDRPPNTNEPGEVRPEQPPTEAPRKPPKRDRDDDS